MGQEGVWGSRWETAEGRAWALEAEAGIPPRSVITGTEEGLPGSPQSRLLVTPFPRALSTLPRAQRGPAHLAPAPLPAPAAGGLLWHRGALGVGRGGHPHPSDSVSLLLTSSRILRATGKETKSSVEGSLGPWALSRPETPPGLPPAAHRSGVSGDPGLSDWRKAQSCARGLLGQAHRERREPCAPRWVVGRLNGDSARGAGTWLAAGFPRELASRAEEPAVKKAWLRMGLLGSCLRPSRRSNMERRVGAPREPSPEQCSRAL